MQVSTGHEGVNNDSIVIDHKNREIELVNKLRCEESVLLSKMGGNMCCIC